MHRWSIRIAALTATVVLLATSGYGVALALQPPPDVSVNRVTLHASLEDASGSAGALFDEVQSCVARRRPGAWDCSVIDREGSGGADYRLRVRSGTNCWSARLTVDYSEGGMPRRVRGCVRGDRWSPWDLVL